MEVSREPPVEVDSIVTQTKENSEVDLRDSQTRLLPAILRGETKTNSKTDKTISLKGSEVDPQNATIRPSGDTASMQNDSALEALCDDLDDILGNSEVRQVAD